MSIRSWCVRSTELKIRSRGRTSRENWSCWSPGWRIKDLRSPSSANTRGWYVTYKLVQLKGDRFVTIFGNTMRNWIWCIENNHLLKCFKTAVSIHHWQPTSCQWWMPISSKVSNNEFHVCKSQFFHGVVVNMYTLHAKDVWFKTRRGDRFLGGCIWERHPG